MNKHRTIRWALAAAGAAAVSMPLLAQVKNAQPAQDAAQQQPPAATAAPQPLPPSTKPIEVDPNKVVASEGKVAVTAGDFNAAVATLPPQYQQMISQPALRKRLADSILQVKLLAEEARRRQLDQKPELKREIEMKSDELLANALAQEVQKVNDQLDHAYFDAHKSDFDLLKARHILVRTPDSQVPQEAGKPELTEAQAKAKADDIKKQLDKGGDFAAIAKAQSDDKGSGMKGGDLGTFSPLAMDTVFSKAALALKPNQVSQPVKTQFGYHIIQLLEDKGRTYEDAKPDIGKARMRDLFEELKGPGKAEYDPAFFGTATANAAGPSTRPTSASGAVPAQNPQAAKKGA